MGREQAISGLLSVFGVLMKMSDEAEALGGATSIAGVASLHKLQTSIQKNGHRIAALAVAIDPSLDPSTHEPAEKS
jgi:hypothetical protein